jgi:vancomycin permeability regulator SanA
MLLLTKVLSALLYPLGLFFAAMIAAGLLHLVGWRRTALAMLLPAVVFLWMVSTPIFAKWAHWQLERHYPPVAMADTPSADVAILLGGVTDPPLPPRQKPDLEAAADRIAHAADLYRAGKVRMIIVSGGAMPWTPEGYTEAEIMAGFSRTGGCRATQ